jgi:hypothetical protein
MKSRSRASKNWRKIEQKNDDDAETHHLPRAYGLRPACAIVSPIPGTTRDAVDSVFTAQDEEGNPIQLRVIDTAGIRRKGKTYEMEERLPVMMAREGSTLLSFR